MNWYSVDIDIAGSKEFLSELNDVINECNDDVRKEYYDDYAHVSSIMKRLHLNSKPCENKHLLFKESRINAKSHLIIRVIFGEYSYSGKRVFQKDIELIMNNFRDKISGINYTYLDWP